MPAIALETLKNDPAAKRQFEAQWAEMTPEDQAKYGSPSQLLAIAGLPFINADQTIKDKYAVDWQAQFQKREELQKPKDSWLVDFGVEINNPGSARYKTLRFGGSNVQFADASLNNFSIDGKDISGFIHKGGKLYALPAKWTNSDKQRVNTFFFDKDKGDYVFVLPDDPNSILIPIEQGQWFTKIMQPYATDSYGKSQLYNTTQDWQTYATSAFPEAFDILGIPKPQGGGQTTPSTTQKGSSGVTWK